MKKYEMIFVLQADEPESELEARVSKVESTIAVNGGEISERNHWGVRQLAYEIQHQTRGNYMHLRFTGDGEAIAKLDNDFRLDHKILRHLCVVDEEWKERNEASRAKRRPAGAAIDTAPAPAAAPAAAPKPAPAPAAEAAPVADVPVTDTAPEAPAPSAPETEGGDAPETPAEQ